MLPDPNLIVAFKNIQKKDSTTKSKALEDIQGHVEILKNKQAGFDEALLETWVRLLGRA